MAKVFVSSAQRAEIARLASRRSQSRHLRRRHRESSRGEEEKKIVRRLKRILRCATDSEIQESEALVLKRMKDDVVGAKRILDESRSPLGGYDAVAPDWIYPRAEKALRSLGVPVCDQYGVQFAEALSIPSIRNRKCRGAPTLTVPEAKVEGGAGKTPNPTTLCLQPRE